MKKFLLLTWVVLLSSLPMPSAWAQCSGVNMGGQCLPPPYVPGSPLYQPEVYGNGGNGNGGYVAPPPRGSELYGSYAFDPKTGNFAWSQDQSSAEKADRKALAACNDSPGASCQILGPIWACTAFAVDRVGMLFQQHDTFPETAARDTMIECNKKSQVGRCRLLSLPVCSGLKREYQDQPNEAARTATPAEVAAWTDKYDGRQYWGALAASSNNSNAVYDLPSEDDAKKAVLAKCAGCTVLGTYKNTCAGWAWPKDKARSAIQYNEIAADTDPSVARQKALAQCSQKYGACTVGVRCSGRAYSKNNPDAQ